MRNQIRKIIREKIELDIDIGDEILAGRFKNKKVIVKTIGKDDKNQPTINGKTILKFRIKKLIKEELNKIFEALDFQADAAHQIAMNMSLFKIPRKGIDDSINNFNIIQTQKEKLENSEEKEEDLETNFQVPPSNTQNAVVKTNMYEAEGIGMYDSTVAMQQNLDVEKTVPPKTSNFSKETEDEFKLHNDNIERALKEIPPGNARSGAITNNKSKNT